MDTFVRISVLTLEVAGGLAIVAGVVLASVAFAIRLLRDGFQASYRPYRENLGRSILLGLELLVASDILKSVATSPTPDDLIVLAGLVIIRTFLSISLGVEISGHWPWEETRLRRSFAAEAHCGGRPRERDTTGHPSETDG